MMFARGRDENSPEEPLNLANIRWPVKEGFRIEIGEMGSPILAGVGSVVLSVGDLEAVLPESADIVLIQDIPIAVEIEVDDAAGPCGHDSSFQIQVLGRTIRQKGDLTSIAELKIEDIKISAKQLLGVAKQTIMEIQIIDIAPVVHFKFPRVADPWV